MPTKLRTRAELRGNESVRMAMADCLQAIKNCDEVEHGKMCECARVIGSWMLWFVEQYEDEHKTVLEARKITHKLKHLLELW